MSWTDPNTHAQFFIALFGVSAVILAQSKSYERRRWASVLGLVGQPFWFWVSWHTQQWGIFFLSILYTMSWAVGFYRSWIAEKGDRSAEAHVVAMRLVVEEDREEMEEDPTGLGLTDRYLSFLCENWNISTFPHISAVKGSWVIVELPEKADESGESGKTPAAPD